MNMNNRISMEMENRILAVDCSNLSGKLLCKRVLDRVDWSDNLGKGKYHITNDDKFYKLLSDINKHNATDDVLIARGCLFAGGLF